MSRETDMDETIHACLFDCFGQATKEAFPRFRLLGSCTFWNETGGIESTLFLLRDNTVSRKSVGSMRREETAHPQNNYQNPDNLISKFTIYTVR